MGSLSRDILYACRTLLGTPRFTVPAVGTLALGIGCVTAVFSIVQAVLLEPLPYRQPDRIVSIWETSVARNQSRGIVAPANFVAWRERSRTLDHLGMVTAARLTMMLADRPAEVVGMQASSDVFAALGVEPARGRSYTSEEDERGRDGVIVIGHEFWQSVLGGRPDVIGSTLQTDGRTRTVLGVMPAGFSVEGQTADFYIPYGWEIERMRTAAGRGSSHAIARLRDGVSLAQASAEMTALMEQLEQEAPQRNAQRSLVLLPIQTATVEAVRPALLVLAGAVVLVMLIACVNVANLLLARSAVRQRELSLRTALGASRWRLLRQMLAESLTLSLAGGAAGVAVAYLAHEALLVAVADRLPGPLLQRAAIDGTVLAFALGTTLATGVAFGLLPAIAATSTAHDALAAGGRHGAGPRTRRALAGLIAVEVALSLVLLASAGLLIRSFMRLQAVDAGFRPDGVLTGRVTLPSARYPQPFQQLALIEGVLDGLRALPSVRSAAGVSFLPMAGPGIGTGFHRLDEPAPPPGQAPSTQVRPITPGFLETMGVARVAGRDFRASDSADAPPVAIVSQGLVQDHFPAEDPIGRRLHVNIGSAAGMDVEIVGVSGDIKFSTLDSDTRTAIYLPYTQLPMGVMTFVLRTEGEPMSLAPAAAAVVREADPELALAEVRPMVAVVDATLARPRTVSTILTAFAFVALLLAAVGVYGVMAYSVSQRTQEIGVRMALGGTASSVFRMITGQALRLVGVGVLAGLVAAAAAGEILASQLFQTGPLDPLAFGGTALLLIAVACVASLLPAWRATCVTPTEALRAE